MGRTHLPAGRVTGQLALSLARFKPATRSAARTQCCPNAVLPERSAEVNSLVSSILEGCGYSIVHKLQTTMAGP